jgi:tRNA (guanine-N7-)-methyltransferase
MLTTVIHRHEAIVTNTTIAQSEQIEAPESVETAPPAQRRLYGRAKGQKLRARPLRLLETLLPKLALPEQGPLDPMVLFSAPVHALWFEIGFGKGEHLVAQACANPHVGLIGAEPFLNGVAACLGQIDTLTPDHPHLQHTVRLFRGDALLLLERLPDACLERLFLLHPDPWPKARHAKRRMVNPGPLDLIARKLKQGAELRIGTDHPIYLTWTLQQMQARADFIWQAQSPQDWEEPAADWPQTRYEAWSKAEGRPVWYLRYLRA